VAGALPATLDRGNENPERGNETMNPKSYKLSTGGDDEDLEEARFATLAEAQELVTATEYGGDGYCRPKIAPSDDAPNITAADYLAAAWPEYPGPCPAGTDPDEWFAGAND